MTETRGETAVKMIKQQKLEGKPPKNDKISETSGETAEKMRK